MRPDGTVKVLDFGIAKANAAVGGLDLHDTMTVTPHATRGGVILGTPGYMSPEQARGQEVDKRTDIWAFGCVLFAMLTGRTPFDGDTLSDVIAATLTTDPDWTALPPDVPEPIRRVLQRCLQRDLVAGCAISATHVPTSTSRSGPIGPPHEGSRGASAARSVSFQRLTDLVGVNEWPAISRDGRMVAFVVAGRGTTADLDPDAVGRRASARDA